MDIKKDFFKIAIAIIGALLLSFFYVLQADNNKQFIFQNARGTEDQNIFKFDINDFNNPVSFVNRLRHAKDPLSKYISERFSLELKKSLIEYDKTQPMSADFKAGLIRELNLMLYDKNLYKEDRLEYLDLPENIKKLIASNPDKKIFPYINRALIDRAYAPDIKRSNIAEIYINELTKKLVPTIARDSQKKGAILPFWVWLILGIILGGSFVFVIVRNRYLKNISKYKHIDFKQNVQTKGEGEIDKTQNEISNNIYEISRTISSFNQDLKDTQEKLEDFKKVSREILELRSEAVSYFKSLLKNQIEIDTQMKSISEIPGQIKELFDKHKIKTADEYLKEETKNTTLETKEVVVEELEKEQKTNYEDISEHEMEIVKLNTEVEGLIAKIRTLEELTDNKRIKNKISRLIYNIKEQNIVKIKFFKEISNILVDLFITKDDTSDKIWCKKIKDVAVAFGFDVKIPSIGSAPTFTYMESISLDNVRELAFKQKATKNLDLVRNSLTSNTILYVIQPRIIYDGSVMNEGSVIIYGKNH